MVERKGCHGGGGSPDTRVMGAPTGCGRGSAGRGRHATQTGTAPAWLWSAIRNTSATSSPLLYTGGV